MFHPSTYRNSLQGRSWSIFLVRGNAPKEIPISNFTLSAQLKLGGSGSTLLVPIYESLRRKSLRLADDEEISSLVLIKMRKIIKAAIVKTENAEAIAKHVGAIFGHRLQSWVTNLSVKFIINNEGMGIGEDHPYHVAVGCARVVWQLFNYMSEEIFQLLGYAGTRVQRAAAGGTLVLMLWSENATIHYKLVGVIENLVNSFPKVNKELLLTEALQPVIKLLSSCFMERQEEAALLLGQIARVDSESKVSILFFSFGIAFAVDYVMSMIVYPQALRKPYGEYKFVLVLQVKEAVIAPPLLDKMSIRSAFECFGIKQLKFGGYHLTEEHALWPFDRGRTKEIMGNLMCVARVPSLKALEELANSYKGWNSNPAVFDASIRACTHIGNTDGAYEVIKKLRKIDEESRVVAFAEKLRVIPLALVLLVGTKLQNISKIWASENTEYKEAYTRQKIESMRAQCSKLTAAAGDISHYQMVANKRISELEATHDLSRIWLHVDMDVFYTAVETLSNPLLKGKPMAVGNMSMISTTNYEAQRFGVRAAMPSFSARKS